MKTYTLVAGIQNKTGETIDGIMIENLTPKEFNELKFTLQDLYWGKKITIYIDRFKETL